MAPVFGLLPGPGISSRSHERVVKGPHRCVGVDQGDHHEGDTEPSVSAPFGGRHGSRTGEQQDFKAVSLGVKLLLLPSTLYFEWDRVTMQVVRLEMAVDFLTPLRREFGNLEDASFVLDGANIAPDSAIRYSCKCLMDQGSGRMLYMYLRTQLIGTMAKF